MRLSRALFRFAIFLGLASACLGQGGVNSNPAYRQLRTLLPGGEVITVHNLELHRDAATFTFLTGDFAFFGEVNGKVTGAVFHGQGHLHIDPATAEERHNLLLLTHTEQFEEDFDRAVLRFTDDTAAQLHKASSGPGSPSMSFQQDASELRNFQRLKLFHNIDLRLLEDVLSPTQSGYFLAAIHGKKNAHLIFTFDPHGAPAVSPEEVSLMSWTDWGETYLTAFPSAASKAVADPDNATYRITQEDLDTTIEKNGFLTGMATLHIVARQDGVAVLRPRLFPTLRVSRVETEDGAPLDYIQERKEEDADFGVVLSHALKKGESATIRIAYGGKDVVTNEGGANYYPEARESWYPNGGRGLGEYAKFTMIFHVPKGLQLIATGTRSSETTEGKITTSVWKTEVPVPVVGFNLGTFKMQEDVVPGKLGDNLTVDAYANIATPDDVSKYAGGVVGTLNTTPMLPVQLSQGRAAAQIYTDYFGPLPFSHIALTQQFACNYGQSWPMLVYLPICAFMDTTQQHFLGLRPEDMYWKVVTPHEVAHQWWGQTVGFRSYRDQWMSEGFANTSASIFLQLTSAKPDRFREFWRQQLKLLTEKNAQGFRPVDVGPVTMGFRTATDKTGWNVYQDLIYPKGAYILHMLRMMMWSRKDGDARFMTTMRDFASTYRLRSATTEDFKAIVEKHMSAEMDLEHNQSMDWFFREYVYGTDVPAYHLESQVAPNDKGVSLQIKLTQSNVPDQFRNLVPIYLELANGNVVRLGSAAITGSSTLEQTVQLPTLPSPIKRVVINYFYDLLSTEK